MMSAVSQVIDKAIELGLRELWFQPVRKISRSVYDNSTMTLYRIISKDAIVGHLLVVPDGVSLVIFNSESGV